MLKNISLSPHVSVGGERDKEQTSSFSLSQVIKRLFVIVSLHLPALLIVFGYFVSILCH